MNRLRQFCADIAAAFRRLCRPKPTRAPRPKVPKVLIVAYNHDAAREYARDNRLNAGDWTYVAEAEHLNGWHNVTIVRLAGWKNRKSGDFMRALARLEAVNKL